MTFQDPVLHSLWKFTITAINQFSYLNRKLNFSNIALIETHGIYEITFNRMVEHTFVATLIQIPALNLIFHAV